MQRAKQQEEFDLHDSNTNLKFPVLHFNAHPQDWLEEGRHGTIRSQAGSMASQTDDSSVDDSLSSIGDSAWDIIDEASAASDDEASNISRQPTPLSDRPEQVHIDNGSLAGNDTSSESQDVRSLNKLAEFSHSRKDSSSDPPDTAKQPVPQERSFYGSSPSFDFIKFLENHVDESRGRHGQDLSSCLIEFQHHDRKRLLEEFQLNDNVEVAGTVRQRIGGKSLQLQGPFKVFYVGPTEMKAPIVEKIASALAANHSSSIRDSIDSSRVTVVPISAFTDNSSPDVVLIDSMGLDMNIEECTSASAERAENLRKTIQLKLSGQKTVESFWSPETDSYTISEEYTLPDLAIIYLPENESISTKQTRLQARSFMLRHGIAVMVISFDSEWKKPVPAMTLDLRCPHLCFESFDVKTKETRVLKRLPVDLNTFINIDAGQMNRNLACLASKDHSRRESTFYEAVKNVSSKTHKTQEQHQRRSTTGHTTRHAVLLMLLFCFTALNFLVNKGFLLSPISFLDNTRLQSYYAPSTEGASSVDISSTSTLQAWPAAQTPPREDIKREEFQQDKTTALASLLLESSFAPNKSDKFRVHVIGDSHIILQPPTWFRQLRKPPALFFRVRRQQKKLNYEFSTLFDGVYALKLPAEDAHGSLDISVWTTRKPKINETFQVEFSTAWSKVAGWQKAAQVMTDQVREELQSAHSGLAKACQHANKRLQSFFQDAAVRADSVLREVEKVGLTSLQQTTKTTEAMINQSRQLSYILSRRLQTQSERASLRLASQRQLLQRDLVLYTRKMSALFSQQASSLAEAASGLNVLALGQEIQEYRERHLREAQKKMLHAWWNVRGPPESSRRTTHKMNGGRRQYPSKSASRG